MFRFKLAPRLKGFGISHNTSMCFTLETFLRRSLKKITSKLITWLIVTLILVHMTHYQSRLINGLKQKFERVQFPYQKIRYH